MRGNSSFAMDSDLRNDRKMSPKCLLAKIFRRQRFQRTQSGQDFLLRKILTGNVVQQRELKKASGSSSKKCNERRSPADLSNL